ncbi:glycerate kinase [Rhabdochromatium marinum]|uniref:glycerate kinase n=1 Tax=Rhabdochromatium marinum TaxID=48729 RepID=UPI0023DEC391|nr:glycerate kinase [Rhabdochromatium marinum]
MRILVAPDSFKGSMSATVFCDIARQVFSRCLSGCEVPGCEMLGLPMADGGEGTAEALVRGTGGELRALTVTGPMRTPVAASYGLLGDGRTAVVEMAQASGLPLVPSQQRDPLQATSYGTGELIVEALRQGAGHIILALGGSATNDGGMGALQALGVRFLDHTGAPVAPIAEALMQIRSVVVDDLQARLGSTRLTIASDVTNPLLGKRGATAVYGPQKGADARTRRHLEQGLAHFADLTDQTTSTDYRDQPGSGAAGGMGYGFLSYLGATLRSGFAVVAETYGLEQRLQENHWDLLITGEGQVDVQSVQGKLVGRLAALGQAHQIPVLVLTGSIRGDLDELYRCGVTSVSSIVEGPMSLKQAMEQAPLLLRRRLTDLCRLWRIRRLSDPVSRAM